MKKLQASTFIAGIVLAGTGAVWAATGIAMFGISMLVVAFLLGFLAS